MTGKEYAMVVALGAAFEDQPIPRRAAVEEKARLLAPLLNFKGEIADTFAATWIDHVLDNLWFRRREAAAMERAK
jgi:hypothetical protein